MSTKMALSAAVGGACAAAWLLGARSRSSSASSAASSAPPSVDAAFAQEMARHCDSKRPAAGVGVEDEADWPISRQDEVALIDRELRALARAGALDIPGLDCSDGDASHVQPASVDLPVGGHESVFTLKRKVLPLGRRMEALLVGDDGEDGGDDGGDGSLVLERRSLAGDGVVLLKGQTYAIRCGDVQLPAGHWGRLSPKSSIGRVDLMVRAVLDGCGLYDQIPGDGKRRTLWLELTPQSFNIRLRKGVALTQLMVLRRRRAAESPDTFDPSTGSWGGFGGAAGGSGGGGGGGGGAAAGSNVADDAALGARAKGSVVFDASGTPLKLSSDCGGGSSGSSGGGEGGCEGGGKEDGELGAVGCRGGQLHNGAIVLSLAVPAYPEDDGEEGAAGGADALPPLIGFEALPTNEVIDLSRPGAHDAADFFRPIRASRRRRFLTMEKDRFYILCTKERVAVPNALSAEMVPFSHHVGELRAHYAGFFDPGFGYGRAGEVCGTIGVLEVRPHETISIYDGQPICLMEFFRNSSSPERPCTYRLAAPRRRRSTAALRAARACRPPPATRRPPPAGWACDATDPLLPLPTTTKTRKCATLSDGFTGNNNYQRQTGPKLAKYFK
jgi:deoxycytidine triphosphate deaminase